MFYRVPKGLEDVSKYVELFSALYASGKWTIQELKQLAGLKFLRVFREVEKVGIQNKNKLFDISIAIECKKKCKTKTLEVNFFLSSLLY